MFTRRRLLLSSASLAALAGFGGYATLSLEPPAAGMYAFSAAELRTVQALAEALFPPGNALGVSAVDMDLGPEIDELMGDRLDPVVTPVFRQALNALNQSTRLSHGAPFVSLPLPDRVSVIAELAEPGSLPRRLLYDALRSVVGMAFFVRPEVNAVIGWDASCAGGVT